MAKLYRKEMKDDFHGIFYEIMKESESEKKDVLVQNDFLFRVNDNKLYIKHYMFKIFIFRNVLL